MIVPDLNLLLYAHDSLSPHHAQANRWWSDCLSQTEPVGLSHGVVLGFLRLSTRAPVFQQPLSIGEAAELVRSWVACSNVQIILPSDGHLDRVLDLLQQLGAAGNLVADAHLAALAIEYDAVLHTTDADFVRFPGLRWFNPLTGLSTGKLRRQ
jgi:toxin-antitoxin system PIN domain toxin